MPDRKRGYVKRRQGILTTDHKMARMYRAAMNEPAAEFTSDIQLVISDAVIDSQDKQRFEAYYIATDITHAHMLLGWRDVRTWLHMRSIVKSSQSRRLNTAFGRRGWFVEGGSRKRVRERRHFDYFVQTYLPRHTGWKWTPERGKFR
jgi:hypothetical protein